MRIMAAAALLAACTQTEKLPLVSVTVYAEDGRTTQPGARVIFHAQDGSVLSVRTTDPNGHTADGIEPGGAVTFTMYPYQQHTSVLGLEGGETLELGGRPEPEAGWTGSIVVNTPGGLDPEERVNSATACGEGGSEGGSSVSLGATNGSCADAPREVLSFTRNETGLTRYTYTVDLPPSTSVVDQPPWRTDFDTTDVRIGNWPPGEHNLDLRAHEQRNGGVYHTDYREFRDAPDVIPLRWTRGFADSRAILLTIGETVTRSTYRTVPASIMVDLEDDRLPLLEPIATEPGRIAFRRSQGVAPIDVIRFRVGSWNIMSPDTEEIVLPQIPEELGGSSSPSPIDVSNVNGIALATSAWTDYQDAVNAVTRSLLWSEPAAETFDGVYQSSTF